MKKRRVALRYFALLSIFCLAPVSAYATNGVNLIGIGPVSRAMGATGTAYTLDAVTAISTNPATMSFASYAGGKQFDFGSTFFMPVLNTRVTAGGGTVTAKGDEKIYPAPAIAFSTPISDTMQFGVAAYGASGLGTDYRNTAVDGQTATAFSQAGVLKFVGALSHKYNEKLSTGIALHIDNGSLDIASGTSFGYALGAQIGTVYKASDNLSMGLAYTTPQKVDHKNIGDFNADGNRDDFTFESPNTISAGVAFKPEAGKFLLAADVKWLNWASAKGWDTLDFENQWVFALGGEYNATDKLALRFGYNYGKSPLKEHNGFDGTGTTSIQGTPMNNYYYETFRIVSCPLILEQHISVGFGYKFTENFALNLAVVHERENTISESGTDATGLNPARLETDLKANSLDFGLSWTF